MSQSMSFEELLTQAVQHTVIDFIRRGDWIKIEYNSKVHVDSAYLRQLHSRVDMSTVMSLVADHVHQKMADAIMNAMATEVANDVKSVMSNKELREDIRSVIRSKIREVEKEVAK